MWVYFVQAWYVGYGAKDVLEQSCKNLQRKIRVFVDGVELELPELEGIVLLNINSWSAGCTVWSESDPSDDFGAARIDDKQLEVIGLYSSFHVGRIQVSMADPIRLGQAHKVKVCIKFHHTPLFDNNNHKGRLDIRVQNPLLTRI